LDLNQRFLAEGRSVLATEAAPLDERDLSC